MASGFREMAPVFHKLVFKVWGDKLRNAAHGCPQIINKAICSDLRFGIERQWVEFIDENGGGPGVRLRKRHQKKP